MLSHIYTHKILIIDFGSQTTQLIARRVREAGVYSEVHRHDISPEFICDFNPSGIILSGSPETVLLDNTPRIPDCIFTLGVPVLGICYGMQVMAQQLGGAVAHAEKREFGHANIWGDMEGEVWMSHGDHVTHLPPGFITIAKSENAPIAAMADERRRFYGFQFHPEVTHTQNGQKMIAHFVHDICGCASNWTPDNIIENSIAQIREQVGDDYVLLGLSGGVDSSVVAALLHKAIGPKLICVFVDHGLLRLNEAEQVMESFAKQMGMNVILVNAQALFLDNLRNITCPEQKRKMIGKLFIDVFESEANKLAYMTDIKWLAQGTIYPDVIESVGIKSHHNVGGLPEKLPFKVLEPIRALFKDEVRQMGLALGLSEKLINRHPFPGPGLGVRVLGEVKAEYTHILRQADAIFLEVLHEFDFYDKVSQAFAVFLPVKAVGVMGDARQYDYVIALRAVQTVDFMTARWAHLPYALLEKASNRIINEVKGITRVTYDISGKPPATIEWE